MAVASVDERRDRVLLRQVAEGDEEAFRELYRRYGAACFALALRLVKQRFLAEEVVQEAFVSLWRTAGAYDASRGSVRTWLLSTTHHRAVDGVRREEAQVRRAQRSAREEPPREDVADVVAEAVDLDQDRAEVRRALQALPPEQRDVVRLMYFEAMTQAQIAERLSVPLGTVKSRCLLAVRRLRKDLAGRGEA